jgi:predicted DCC family thiol-disulfide oxidoreductase YuxK
MPRTLTVPDVVSSRPVRVALVAALAVGLLGGCSFGGSAPAPTSTSPVATVAASPTPTVTAAPSPAATPKPERPAAMDVVNVDGAAAAATYFLQLFPYVLNTGDLTDWTALKDGECKFCSGVADDVNRLIQLGQHQIGTDIAVESATGVEIRPGASFSVDIVFAQAPWAIVDSIGAVVDSAADTTRFHALIVVLRDGDRWLIRGVQIDPADG